LLLAIAFLAAACSNPENVSMEYKPVAANAAPDDSTRRLAAFVHSCKRPGGFSWDRFGNKHVRYWTVCQQGRIWIHFHADPPFEKRGAQFSYDITVEGCSPLPNQARSIWFKGKFFEQPITSQLEGLKNSIRKDISQIEKFCSRKVDTNRLLGTEFDKEYVPFGDGWWLKS
jgi:hypothetical protein